MILQPWIKNHPDLVPLTNGNLATLRLITFKDTAGVAVEFKAIFRMPCGTNIVDNFQQGNLVASVDLATGELGQTYSKQDGVLTMTEIHPDTGCVIAGEKLPYWEDIRALCRKAQECCDKEPFVGWDVAITQEGPLLLEANPTFGIEGLQAAHGVGIGESTLTGRMAELMSAV